MKNAYFIFSTVFFLVAIFALIHLPSSENIDNQLLLGFIEIPLGFMQLFAGIYLAVKMNCSAKWVSRAIRFYWIMTGVYFAILILLSSSGRSMYDDSFMQVWLFGVPWIIAIYQFILIVRLKSSYYRKIHTKS